MGVAHLLDVDGATDELAGLTGTRPMLTADRLSFLALAPVTPFETAELERRGPHVVGLDRAIADPEGAAREALAALGAAVVAVHFDVDVLDFRDAPLAENTDRAPGAAARRGGTGAGDAVRRPARGRADGDRVQPAPRRRRRRRHAPPDRGPRRRAGVAPRATIAGVLGRCLAPLVIACAVAAPAQAQPRALVPRGTPLKVVVLPLPQPGERVPTTAQLDRTMRGVRALVPPGELRPLPPRLPDRAARDPGPQPGGGARPRRDADRRGPRHRRGGRDPGPDPGDRAARGELRQPRPGPDPRHLLAAGRDRRARARPRARPRSRARPDRVPAPVPAARLRAAPAERLRVRRRARRDGARRRPLRRVRASSRSGSRRCTTRRRDAR